MKFNFHAHTIEQDDRGIFEVFGHGEYPEDSVLCGQHARILCDRFDTLGEALEAYPQATVSEYSTRIPTGWMPMSDLPPSWFDPTACGERWDDDY